MFPRYLNSNSSSACSAIVRWGRIGEGDGLKVIASGLKGKLPTPLFAPLLLVKLGLVNPLLFVGELEGRSNGSQAARRAEMEVVPNISYVMYVWRYWREIIIR